MALTIFKTLFITLVLSSVCIPFFAWIIVCNMSFPWKLLVPAFTFVLDTVVNILLIIFFPLNSEVPQAPSPWAKSLVDVIINFGAAAVQIFSPRSLFYLSMSNLVMIYLVTLLLIVKPTNIGLLDLFIAIMPSFLQYFVDKRMILLIITTTILLGVLICVRNNYEKFMLSITANNLTNFIVTKAENLFDFLRANYLALIWKRKRKYEVGEEAAGHQGHVKIQVNDEEHAVDEMIPVDAGHYKENHSNMNTYLDDGDDDDTDDERGAGTGGGGAGTAGGGACTGGVGMARGGACTGGACKAGGGAVTAGGGAGTAGGGACMGGAGTAGGGACTGGVGMAGGGACTAGGGACTAEGGVDQRHVNGLEAYYCVGGDDKNGFGERGVDGKEEPHSVVEAGGDSDNDEIDDAPGLDGDEAYQGVVGVRGEVDREEAGGGRDYKETNDEVDFDGDEDYRGVDGARGGGDNEEFGFWEESGRGYDDEETKDAADFDGDEDYHGVVGVDGGDFDDVESGKETNMDGDKAFHRVVEAGGGADDEDSGDEPDVDGFEAYHDVGRAGAGVDERRVDDKEAYHGVGDADHDQVDDAVFADDHAMSAGVE